MTTQREPSPSLAEWRSLYDAAIRIKELAPWEWMSEADMFCVQDPETREIGYVSVTGALGEHLSITAYLGALAFHKFWYIHQNPEHVYTHPEELMEMRQLQASFEDRSELTKRDRDVIKKLGLKFRGRQAWPLFRSMLPGYFPWHLEPWEARFLTHILEQTLEVAPRLMEDPDAILPDDVIEGPYLIRTPRQQGEELVWGDEWRSVPKPELTLALAMDTELLERVARLPKAAGASVEMDFFAIFAKIQGSPQDRPVLPYILMMVDRGNGMILNFDMMIPSPHLADVWEQIPYKTVEAFAKLGALPQVVYVQNEFLASLLGSLTDSLGFEVRVTSAFRHLDEAREFLSSRL